MDVEKVIKANGIQDGLAVFSSRADAYAKARPGYPEALADYILSLLPVNSTIADLGAGTGKFSEVLARRGVNLFAVEPNLEMRTHLENTLAPYPNAKAIKGTATATTLPSKSVDGITAAQALHWFGDLNSFRQECQRIGKPQALVFVIYNNTPSLRTGHFKVVVDSFFTNPTVREFDNPLTYTRQTWLDFMNSHSVSPLPSDPTYAQHIADANADFDRDSVDGVLTLPITTTVYSEFI